ncbi:MAG: redoxin domain-containing protein [Humidesulfovibrio sp.]|nr:redoxin domain-containing protein [Humidesulfovibrio sp.]
MRKTCAPCVLAVLVWTALVLTSVLTPILAPAPALAVDLKDMIFDPGLLKPLDSTLKVRPGQVAPDFALPGILGETVRLSDFRGKKNVMLSFVPAAFTPVCSDQWPGYNLIREMFEERDTIILGITVDNLPSLYAWAVEMRGLWFPVLSDFWPHGAVAKKFGVLRTSGTTERAIVLIDKKGVVRFARSFDINIRPELGLIMGELDKLAK